MSCTKKSQSKTTTHKKLDSAILHSIKENKQFIIDYDDSFKQNLEIIVENLFNEDFDVNKENCDCCEFKDVICKY